MLLTTLQHKRLTIHHKNMKVLFSKFNFGFNIIYDELRA
jgi:hypothetical protein